MAIKGVALTVIYYAWDTANNTFKTGDVGNHTMRVVTDGTATAADNSPAEVENGAYKLLLSTDEMDGNFITWEGSSSTADIEIFGGSVVTEQGVLATLAVPGDEMDLIDAPNSTAITAIQSGLSTLAAGAEMDLIDAPNSTAITAIQSGLSTLAAGAEMDLIDAPNSTAIAAAALALIEADLAGYEASAKTGTKLGEMMALIRAFAAGKFAINGSPPVQTLYETDGVTEICTTPLASDYSTRGAPE